MLCFFSNQTCRSSRPLTYWFFKTDYGKPVCWRITKLFTGVISLFHAFAALSVSLSLFQQWVGRSCSTTHSLPLKPSFLLIQEEKALRNRGESRTRNNKKHSFPIISQKTLLSCNKKKSFNNKKVEWLAIYCWKLRLAFFCARCF